MRDRSSYSCNNSTEFKEQLADQLASWYNLVQGEPKSNGRDKSYRVLRPNKLATDLVGESVESLIDEHLARSRDKSLRNAPSPHPTAKATSAKPRTRLNSRDVQVFYPEELKSSEKRSKPSEKSDKDRITEAMALAYENNGVRTIPAFKNIHTIVKSVRSDFHNFSSVLDHLNGELMLSGMSKASNFSFTPLLLDGPPGVGKTAFAQRVAKELKLPYLKLSAGGMQAPFQLTGTASHWSNSHPGEIFNILAINKTATAVILLDEVDKIPENPAHPILPSLLELLEPETAQRYRDESLQMVFDASRLIVLMTSNSTENMNSALLSRVCKFSIESPGFDQKMRIALNTFSDLCDRVGRHRRLTIDKEALVAVVNRDISTRSLIQGVKAGFVHALSTGQKVVLPMPDSEENKNDDHPTRGIGFHANLYGPRKDNIYRFDRRN